MNIGNNRNNKKFANNKKNRTGKFQHQFSGQNLPNNINSFTNSSTQSQQFYKNGMLNTQNSQVIQLNLLFLT